ncbi:MAG: ABC transporter ATP-binding protein [Planctomycetota bacterium]|jgi:ABC-2 type transport system ATP-binding protein
MEIVEINHIRKEFGTIVAVNNASFSVDKGQVLGLIGPNGAGKTTLLRILATVLRPTTGSVRLLGYDLAKEYLQIRKYIGFMPDFFNLYNDLTPRECLEFFAKAYQVKQDLIPKRIDQTLEYVELEDKRDSLIRHLSRGMVQRMGVAVLLIHDPDLLLLDEPASGLDPKARIQLRNVLNKLSTQGKTIIISSHILTELSGFCSHIAIMDKGNIKLHGAVEEIQQKIAGSTIINISVLKDCDKAVELIKKFQDASIITVENNNITVEMDKGPEGLADLNTHLVNEGIKVVSFSEQKTDLEDLFMKISSEEN